MFSPSEDFKVYGLETEESPCVLYNLPKKKDLYEGQVIKLKKPKWYDNFLT